MKTTDQIVRLVRAGAILIFDGGSKTTDQLITIVNAVPQGNRITITNLSAKTTDQLERIARVAGGRAVLDIR